MCVRMCVTPCLSLHFFSICELQIIAETHGTHPLGKILLKLLNLHLYYYCISIVNSYCHCILENVCMCADFCNCFCTIVQMAAVYLVRVVNKVEGMKAVSALECLQGHVCLEGSGCTVTFMGLNV